MQYAFNNELKELLKVCANWVLRVFNGFTIEQVIQQGATSLEKGKVQNVEHIYRNFRYSSFASRN